ncbi:MAG: AraC family transcriptional regulator [Lachnospiraceae bacterium]|nr:AraC family transcriptional regulator [Lachnospiraceae bacterium]MDD3614701.1 AraC family transcriptional regulator [Lachnospiraceae bacterium]
MEIKIGNNQMEEIEGLHPEYPYTMHHVDTSKIAIPWHWHEEVEFDYIVEGNTKLQTVNQSYILHKGEACFINRNVLCTFDNKTPCIMDSHLFHAAFLGGYYKSIFETKYLNPVLQNKKAEVVIISGETTRQKEMLEKLRKTAALQQQENTEFQTRNYFSEIWLLLLKEIQEMNTSNTPITTVNQERIQAMLSYIHENYKSKLTLEEIARAASISKRECIRCFQTSIHKSAFDYLMDYRIEVAKRLLHTTNLSVLEVAMESGFSEGAYFGKIFKKKCGKTPGAYRKLLN